MWSLKLALKEGQRFQAGYSIEVSMYESQLGAVRGTEAFQRVVLSQGSEMLPEEARHTRVK